VSGAFGLVAVKEAKQHLQSVHGSAVGSLRAMSSTHPQDIADGCAHVQHVAIIVMVQCPDLYLSL
jgi:hypothetical protein